MLIYVNTYTDSGTHTDSRYYRCLELCTHIIYTYICIAHTDRYIHICKYKYTYK